MRDKCVTPRYILGWKSGRRIHFFKKSGCLSGCRTATGIHLVDAAPTSSLTDALYTFSLAWVKVTYFGWRSMQYASEKLFCSVYWMTEELERSLQAPTARNKAINQNLRILRTRELRELVFQGLHWVLVSKSVLVYRSVNCKAVSCRTIFGTRRDAHAQGDVGFEYAMPWRTSLLNRFGKTFS